MTWCNTIRDIPARLNASVALIDVDLPGFRFHHPKESTPVSGPSSKDDVDYLNCYQKDPVMLMHNPPHPGELVRRQCLEPLGLTVTEVAKGLAVSRSTLSLLLNGRLGISPEMAIRLSQAFGGSPQGWLQQQMQYDLWHAQQGRERIAVRKFAA